MLAFKAYVKILWRIRWQLMIYIGVFVGMAFIFSASGGAQRAVAFEGTKTAVAWIEEGEPSALSTGLKEALAPYADFRDLPSDPGGQKDALFFRQVEAILRVPAGFEAAFLRGDEVKIDRTTVPDSMGGYAIDARVDKYLNTARVYRDNVPGMTAEEVAALVKDDLTAGAAASFLEGHVVDQRAMYCNSFFNYSCYTMFVVMILGVSSAMIAFSKSEIHMRNAASPVPPRALSRQLFAGSLVLAAVTSVVILLLGVLMYGDVLMRSVGALLSLNVVVFSVVALSVSFLVANLIKDRNTSNAVANVVGLGTSFISGAFVPQAMLGSSVLFVASFTPSYWFIRANNEIFALTRFDWSGLSKVFPNMGVEIVFAAAIFAVTQVVVKYKRA